MFTRFRQLNSDGFTLIEIIASITILGIVVIAFLPIFPQISSWNGKTSDNLTASNLLSEVAEDVKDITVSELFQGDISDCPEYQPDDVFFSNYLGEYEARINVCNEKEVNLYRTKINIYTPDGSLVSESYTYISGDRDE
ncbi:type II secretion system protein [Virgibacillus kekensis]|uniref:Type II secretion system protein n=1 Tax=Virgibacillus kekensis TaxID=202261 RepID=A0ABV9DD72_9BACI